MASPLFFMIMNVYVDGFNVCHRCVHGTDYKWLDFHALVELCMRGESIQINTIYYFTAYTRGVISL